MKSIVADESVDFRIVTELRTIGLDVCAICEEQPSIPDAIVLDIADKRNALLITEDKDFGELVFRLRLPHKGILLIRIEDRSKIALIAHTIAENYDELCGRFAVINDKKLRIRE